MRRHIFEKLQILCVEARLEQEHSRHVAARPRQALHETGLHRIAADAEHDRYCTGQPMQYLGERGGTCNDDIWCRGDKLHRVGTYEVRIIAADRAKIEANIPSFRPPELLESLLEQPD